MYFFSEPLKGEIKTDIFDKIWARFMLGLFGDNFDIIDAEICCKGSFGYELNILEVSSLHVGNHYFDNLIRGHIFLI